MKLNIDDINVLLCIYYVIYSYLMFISLAALSSRPAVLNQKELSLKLVGVVSECRFLILRIF